MEVSLAIASKRDHRTFDPGPLGSDEIASILDAGRLAGSARNRQPWQFVVATSAEDRGQLAPLVYVPAMIVRAPLAVGVIATVSGSAMSGFDAGRAAQNMMLAAWELGIASCPNGIASPAAAKVVLELTNDEALITILAFGRPAIWRDPTRRDVAGWSAGADRRSLQSLVRGVLRG